MKNIQRKDIWLIGIIVLISVAGLLFFRTIDKHDRVIAVIMHNQQVIERIDLSQIAEPRIITIDGDYQNIIRVEKDRIRFEKSTCPEQICVHSGWLTHYGDIAVCMPNKTLIDIQQK